MNNDSHKTIGLMTAIMIGVNAMIGASIFTIPEQLSLTVGPAALLTYAFVIFGVWCIASSLAYVAQYYATEGSFYSYVSAWAGKKAGLFAAMSYIIGLIIALGLLTRITGTYLNTQFPAIPAYILSGIALVLLLITLIAGHKMARWGQIFLLIFTLAPMIIITALCFSNASFARLTPFMPHGFGSVFTAMKYVIFGFFGFEAITSLHNIVDQPEKTVPRAITWSIAAVSIIYVAFILSTLVGIPSELFATHHSLDKVLYAQFPQLNWLISMIVWGIIITILGTIHSMVWAVGTMITSICTLGNFGYKTTQKQAIIGVGILVYLCSIAFSNLNLFFSLTSIGIISALIMAIMPVALQKIPVPVRTRIVAYFGLIAAIVMVGYAVLGIIN